jgi:hypothetical protein
MFHWSGVLPIKFLFKYCIDVLFFILLQFEISKNYMYICLFFNILKFTIEIICRL